MIRETLRDWHRWEANDGALKPLLPGVALTPDCEQFWVRRAAGQPWRLEFLLDQWSTESEWVYKRDARVRRMGAAHPTGRRGRLRRWRNRRN